MSFLALQWVRKLRMANPTQKLILNEMAHRCEDDGTAAFPGKPTLAEFAGCSISSVHRHVNALIEQGLIEVAEDQSPAAYIPERYRPVVYSLLIPFDWYSPEQQDEVNLDRARRGLPPLTSELRPKRDPGGRKSYPGRARDQEKNRKPAPIIEPAPEPVEAQGSHDETPAEGSHDATRNPESGVARSTDQGSHRATQLSPIPSGTKSGRSEADARVAEPDRTGPDRPSSPRGAKTTAPADVVAMVGALPWRNSDGQPVMLTRGDRVLVLDAVGDAVTSGRCTLDQAAYVVTNAIRQARTNPTRYVLNAFGDLLPDLLPADDLGCLPLAPARRLPACDTCGARDGEPAGGRVVEDPVTGRGRPCPNCRITPVKGATP